MWIDPTIRDSVDTICAVAGNRTLTTQLNQPTEKDLWRSLTIPGLGAPKATSYCHIYTPAVMCTYLYRR
jgi:hypothetical protein